MCCEPVLAGASAPRLDDRGPSYHVALDPTPHAASAARRFVRDQVGDGLPDDVVDVLLLLTSELVTNGVLHARTPLELGVTLVGDQVLVCLGDHDGSAPLQPAADHDRPSGRGVLLIDALAHSWGYTPSVAGKSVWFTVSRQSAHALAAR